MHRFLVRGTIEDRMHKLLQSVQAPVNSHNSEETNMTIGDLTALFTEIQVHVNGMITKAMVVILLCLSLFESFPVVHICSMPLHVFRYRNVPN